MEILVPITFMVCISGIILVALWLKHKARIATLDTLRQALNVRDDLDAQTLKSIASPSPGPTTDLRRGALLVALTLAGLLFSLAIPIEARRIIIGLLAFPSVMGLTHIGFYLFRWQSPEA